MNPSSSDDEEMSNEAAYVLVMISNGNMCDEKVGDDSRDQKAKNTKIDDNDDQELLTKKKRKLAAETKKRQGLDFKQNYPQLNQQNRDEEKQGLQALQKENSDFHETEEERLKKERKRRYHATETQAKRLQKLQDTSVIAKHRNEIKTVVWHAFNSLNVGLLQTSKRRRQKRTTTALINASVSSEKAGYLCDKVGKKSNFGLKAGEVRTLANSKTYYLKSDEKNSLRRAKEKQYPVSCFAVFHDPRNSARKVVGVLLASSGIVLEEKHLSMGDRTEIIGDGVHCHYKVTSYKVGFIDLLGVEPSGVRHGAKTSGQGYGKNLMGAAMEDFTKSGTDIVFLFSTEQARTFYEKKFDFKPVDNRVKAPYDVSMNGSNADCYMMKQISSNILENRKKYHLVVDKEGMKQEHW